MIIFEGLAPNTKQIFETISKLNCIKPYTLIGGTALALHLNKRLSEDLDFCMWLQKEKDPPKINIYEIETELSKNFDPFEKEIVEFNQINYFINDVKITFYSKEEHISPIKNVKMLKKHNNLVISDIYSIGVMKIELTNRRHEWRDYYDIYSILRENYSLVELIKDASEYSIKFKNNKKFYKTKTKKTDLASRLCDGNNFKKEKDFELLNPKYDVNENDIEKFIKFNTDIKNLKNIK